MSPDRVEQQHRDIDEETTALMDEHGISGSLDDCNIEEAQRRVASDQSQLQEFGSDEDVTFVSIVNYGDDRFERVCDTADRRLSPPEQLFHEWLNTKETLKENGHGEVTSHNEAFDDVGYDDRFPRYLNFNTTAESACIEYAKRIANGEHIVFVCYCGEGKMCHRKHVVIEVRKWLDVIEHSGEYDDTDDSEWTKLEDFEE